MYNTIGAINKLCNRDIERRGRVIQNINQAYGGEVKYFELCNYHT